MEKLKYIVEDSTIAELLGVQNFTNVESAVLELVKNSYDACAQKVKISFSGSCLIITDDGIGMDKATIHQNWMHVGKSDKGYSTTDDDGNQERILAGSKGVGRFALARLGASVVVYSVKKKSTPVKWITNWNESILDDWDNPENMSTGTRIEISGLRDRWTDRKISNLIDYLSITFNDDRMKIEVDPCFGNKVSYIFKNPKVGKNYVSKIHLAYNSDDRMLHYVFDSDEFISDAQYYCPDLDLHHFEGNASVIDELAGDREVDFSEEELKDVLTSLGGFSADLYFSLKLSTSKDCENFLYKYNTLSDRYDNGIVLYRNAFSISSFDGKQDWLEFNKRSRKSPAAATHPTGSWRVRGNQVSGKVAIDKKNNPYLKDLANRQGIEVNEHYKLFVKIIIIGIAAFERYRQTIIRSINKKNRVKEQPTTPLIDQILEDPDKVKSLTASDTKVLAKELSTVKEESKHYKAEKETTEKRYRYDVRILNVLATTGLKASSIAHEMKNDRNSISVNYEYIVAALKEYAFWDELNSPECTELSYKNVPQLLIRNKEINQKIVAFMDTMLDEIEKQKFSPKNLSINSILETIKTNWMRDYASLEIVLDMDESVYFDTSEDVFTAIFDNLILNSWQQNKTTSKINISISVQKNNDLLKISYTDDGVGLPPKYINDPMRILAVHESSRDNGHGLGMWIVNNTIQMTGGEVISIDGHNGFSFCFEIGEKL